MGKAFHTTGPENGVSLPMVPKKGYLLLRMVLKRGYWGVLKHWYCHGVVLFCKIVDYSGPERGVTLLLIILKSVYLLYSAWVAFKEGCLLQWFWKCLSSLWVALARGCIKFGCKLNFLVLRFCGVLSRGIGDDLRRGFSCH